MIKKCTAGRKKKQAGRNSQKCGTNPTENGQINYTKVQEGYQSDIKEEAVKNYRSHICTRNVKRYGTRKRVLTKYLIWHRIKML